MNKFALGLAIIGAITASIGFYNIAKGSMSPRPVLYEQKVLDSWTAFKVMHVRSYATQQEESLRLSIFNDNIKAINELNSNPEHTFTAGVNQFSDLSAEEFSAKFMGFDAKLYKADPSIEVIKANPDLTYGEVDWVAKGGVTPMKNQGGCGGCWTFATTGTLETLDFIKNGRLQTFSEQQLIDCDTGSYVPYTPGNHGCKGGLPSNALKYTSYNGITTEGAYPYQERQTGSCDYQFGMREFKNNSYKEIESTVGALQTALQSGTAAIGIDGSCLQHYTVGIYNGNCYNGLNHAVLVVGYGSGYFKLKNSWGTTFGEKGFFRLATRDNGSGVMGMMELMVQAS